MDFDLHQLIVNTVYPLTQLAERKNIELLTIVDENIPQWGRSAPERIRQILTNLLSNAIKFTSVGKVLLHVVLKEETQDAYIIQFSVHDTGIGIAKDVIPKLFTAFMQADGSTTRKFGGTGLGLAICKNPTKMLDGKITVISTPGEGSIFTCQIPIKKPTKEHDIERLKYPEFWLKGKSFLIVDDNATSCRILQIHLEAAGAEVKLAQDAEKALELLSLSIQEQKPFDFALLDYQMPGMDGLELANKIHSNPQFNCVSLILLTSISHVQTTHTLRQAGISSFLVKPICKQKLMQCIASSI